MKIKQTTLAAPIIKLPDNFATLLRTNDDGAALYEFRFISETAIALKSGYSTVRLSIRKELPQSIPDVFSTVRESVDTRKFLSDLLIADPRTKDTHRDSLASDIVSVNADLTSNFDNSKTGSIFKVDSSSVLGTRRVFELKNTAELKKSNIDPPVLKTARSEAATFSHGEMQIAANNLIANGIDPSVAGTPDKNVPGAFSSFNGTSRVQIADSDKNRKILRSTLRSANIESSTFRTTATENSVVPVVSDMSISWIINTKRVVVPPEVGYNDFYVTFSLLDALGNTVEVISRKVSHAKLIRVHNTPKIAPRIAIAPTQFSGKNVIEIEQLDPRATRVKLLRRRIQRVGIVEHAQYEHVAEIPLLRRDGVHKFIDVVNNASILLYRCIAVGPSGIAGSEFMNAVSPAVKLKDVARAHRSIHAAINVKTINDGFAITITSMPPEAVSASIRRRDLTLRENRCSYIDVIDPVRLAGQSLSNMVFVDRDVKNEHVYEYSCELTYRDGTVEQSTGVAIKKYVSLTIGAAVVQITNLEVIRDTARLDVRFNVTSQLTDTGLTLVKKALDKQGLADLYSSELETERDRLQKLIAHDISRVDVTLGQEESFGTIVDSAFSDAQLGARTGVSALKPGHKYRYVISTLVRDAETLFEEFVKSKTDDSTGRTYTYKPSMFRHPFSLARGTIVTRESLISNHSEDEFAYGHIGNSHEIDVTLDVNAPRILSASASRTDRRTVGVQWTVTGSITHIDHFIIVKERLGTSIIVGKMHNTSASKSFEFFDTLSPDDIGVVSYSITPVLYDFNRSESFTTNAITVADSRSMHGIS